MARESADNAVIRLQLLAELQLHYKSFLVFLYDVMRLLGFGVTDIQADIASYLEYGPQYRMVQAQRGQAKTTITAAYAVWRLIHNPRARVLILSAGGDQATDISILCVRIIEGMEVLECLRPDKNAGDRDSVTSYDLHHTLKGIDKSPSITSIGVTANIQGKRADILIADDIESQKNSDTVEARAKLVHLTKDFTSINQNGDIIYLGTPQTAHSIYNTLPARGFTIRIWPGRYPTDEQILKYGNHLAPLIASRIAANPSLQTGCGPAGDQGAPVDPVILGEETLVKKEIDQGSTYFMLQHMLLTDLGDALKYPLKLRNFMVLALTKDHCPASMVWLPSKEKRVPIPERSAVRGAEMYYPHGISKAMLPWESKALFIDPAGGGANGDETGYSALGFCAGYIGLFEVNGVRGGYDDAQCKELCEVLKRWDIKKVVIEQNYGHGAFAKIFRSYCTKNDIKCSIEEVYNKGRKEVRMCDTLEPVLGAHRLLLNETIIEQDYLSAEKYALAKRPGYQFLFQIAYMTREPKCLDHDDRADATAGGVAIWAEKLARDAAAEEQKSEEKAYTDWFNDPLGRGVSRKVQKAPALARKFQQVFKRR